MAGKLQGDRFKDRLSEGEGKRRFFFGLSLSAKTSWNWLVIVGVIIVV